jgi:8-oxo-dGTP pyrophosphatase MutT (NUDIX family)
MAPDDDQPDARRSGKRRRRRRRPRRASPADGSAPRGGRTTGSDAKTSGSEQGTGSKGSATKGTGSEARSKGSRSKGAKAKTGKAESGKPRAAKRKRAPTVTEVSAGGVVYRRDDDGIEILLAARRTRRGALAWGLAKGGIEDGETAETAAIREVREETGIDAEIEGSLGETRYTYVWEDVRIRKTVHFFLMRAIGGDPTDHDDEMEDVRWFPLERALKRAAYRGERTTLQRAADLLR